MNTKYKQSFWKILTKLGIALFFLNSIVFIFLGKLNADEGWYLYASQLVFRGSLPFRDFAFTQTPLLPYIYALPYNLIFHSIYMGRITTVIFSLSAFLLSVLVAKIHGGKMAMGVTAFLGATFIYGIYYQSITKTYALTTFFFMLVFYFLSVKSGKELKYILATLFVLLATLTRLSALFFAIPVILYSCFLCNRKNKIILIVLCLLAASWILFLALPNMDAARWGLITYHTSAWGNKSTTGRIMEILFSRIPEILDTFPQYALIFLILLAMGIPKLIGQIRQYQVIVVIMTGLILFIIPNLTSGRFFAEYLVPLIFVSFPIAGLAYAKLFTLNNKYVKIGFSFLFLLAGGMGLFHYGYSNIDISGGVLPVQEIRHVSDLIKENTRPEDKIFVLEALWVAVESNRDVMQNMTMAQFSINDSLSTNSASHLHLINGQIAFDYIKNSIPKIIVLTDADLENLKYSGYYPEIINAIDKNYRHLTKKMENFGQSNSRLYIYISNPVK